MHKIGRSVQFIGLVVAGAALFVGVLGHEVRRELLLLGLGAGIFAAGYMLQRSGK
jgi:hypothetical protein